MCWKKNNQILVLKTDTNQTYLVLRDIVVVGVVSCFLYLLLLPPLLHSPFDFYQWKLIAKDISTVIKKTVYKILLLLCLRVEFCFSMGWMSYIKLKKTFLFALVDGNFVYKLDIQNLCFLRQSPFSHQNFKIKMHSSPSLESELFGGSWKFGHTQKNSVFWTVVLEISYKWWAYFGAK